MRYRTIDVRIWGDEKFRSLSPLKPSGQALFLYLLTNPNTNSIPGLYRAGAAAMAEELGWEMKAFREAFEEVLAQGLAQADFLARAIFIPNAIKYNKPHSPNVVTSWRSHWDEVPECELKNVAYHKLKAFLEGLGEAFAKAFDDAIAKPSPKAMPNQEQEQDQEQDQENNLCKVVPTSRRVVSKKTYSADMQEIFDYWKEKLNHPKAILDNKRTGKIKTALELGYSVKDLKLAIDGCAATPFNCGDNERGQRYDDIELILRDATHIDRFIANTSASPSTSSVSKSTTMLGVE